jgi:deoxyribose-phosphate aldolase
VAAICIWPDFILQARERLSSESRIRIATVVNFPDGNDDPDSVVGQARKVIADGADEIDLVIPWQALRAGDENAVSDLVAAVRAAIPAGALLKAILESGELRTSTLIRRASELAIEAGADFIKTSTGKVPVSATPDAAQVMLDVIASSTRPVGFKASGGIRQLTDARVYIELVRKRPGPQWLNPKRFRIGASGLLHAARASLINTPGCQ